MSTPHIALPRPRPGLPPEPRVPRPERWELPNGLRVVAVPHPGLPQVVARLSLPAGSASDPASHAGLAALTGRVITEGTEDHSADELNERLDRLGASLDVSVGHDTADVEAFFLSETLEEGFELMGEILLRPTFPEAEMERLRAELLDQLEAREDEPANVADDHTSKLVFGEDHAYGRLPSGTPEGLASVSREELVRLHAERYRPAGSVLVLAGAFELPPLRRVLERTFGGWQGAAAPISIPEPLRAPEHAGSRVDLPWEDAYQAEIRIAGRGLRRDDPDWIPAAVTNYILGGSTITGRLGANLREDKGWTYGARSAFSAGLVAGGWSAEAAVDIEVADAAVAEMLTEIGRLRDEPVDADELDRAKQALILSLPRAFETPGRVVSRFGTLETYDLPRDYWEHFPERVASVTAEQVQRIARGFFAPDALVQVLVGTGTE